MRAGIAGLVVVALGALEFVLACRGRIYRRLSASQAAAAVIVQQGGALAAGRLGM